SRPAPGSRGSARRAAWSLRVSILGLAREPHAALVLDERRPFVARGLDHRRWRRRLGAGRGGAPAGDGLRPVARDLVAEDEEQVAAARLPEAEVDRLLLVGDDLRLRRRVADGGELRGHDARDVLGAAAAQLVVAPQDDVVEGAGRDARHLA